MKSMSATPFHTTLLLERKELYHFLAKCQQMSHKQGYPYIASISLEIPPLDPLAVLDTICYPQPQHFYLEKPGFWAIAALGSAVKLTYTQSDRFPVAQEFIQNCLSRTLSTGSLNLPFSGAHFFCSFTFFPDTLHTNIFPAATVFLPEVQISKYLQNSVVTINKEIHFRDNIKQISEYFNSQINIVQNCICKLYLFQHKNRNPINENSIQESEDIFKNSVLQSLNSIQDNILQKIVLAHTISVRSEKNWEPLVALANLRKQYPDCYIFSTRNSSGQSFIGASPERLLSVRDSCLTTDALAGSAPRGKRLQEDIKLAQTLLSSEKEKREHLMVLEFILERLRSLGLAPCAKPLRLMQLSNIQHLWTPIQADLPADIHILQILEQLHPTPAVAGVPRDMALQNIRQYEPEDRCLYAAPLGWVDNHGNGEFIVGIRSAFIDGDRARLYAGAGIVAGSQPERELAEVQLKLQALLKALV
ncbi:isochorismate synthase [Geitlerinema sp. PCC 9228]|uniref:isochorismate synthase n=1 Tax=Geitlerinema sp. PCC 9228 TaxID=111611 RepID=UPI000B023645